MLERQIAAKLASGPHFGLRMTKTMVQRGLDMGFTDAIEAEAQAQAICMQTGRSLATNAL